MEVSSEHASPSFPLFIYINGFPGVGKLSVARELQLSLFPSLTFRVENKTANLVCFIRRNLIARSRLIDNHLLIDPCAAVFERDMPEYRPLRNSIVSLLYLSIC